MLVCVQCRVEMQCDKTGVGADFGQGHVYHSDRFKCPKCGVMILNTGHSACFDPEYKYQEEYLEMAKKGEA